MVDPTPVADPSVGAGPDLFIDDDDRYSRLRLIPWWRQERLAAARVLVVGAGALGNEALKNLALLGVGRTLVVDFDCIEPSNLSRSVLFRAEDAGQPKAEVAARRARELNPEVAWRGVRGDILTDVGLSTFAEADVVLGCLDNREARLWVNRQCWKVGTPWIDAGIGEFQGVVKVFVPPDSPCYECAMAARDYQLLNLRYSCPLLRREDIQAGKVPTAPTVAALMAALQVQEALKLLHDLPAAVGSALVFNGVGNQFYTTRLPFRPDCLSHETYPAPTPLPLGPDATAAELFATVGPVLPGPRTLELDRDVVTHLNCPACASTRPIFRPRSQVAQAEAICPHCTGAARPELISAVAEGTALAGRSLAELGIPAGDIVRVAGAGALGYFRLDPPGVPTAWDF